MSNLTGIQPPPKPADRGNQRAAKHSLYVKSPNGLKLRYRRVRRLVRKMQAVMPWLDPADDPACRAWAELEILGAHAFADLMERGLTNKKGDPRRLLGEFRMIRQAQLGYERDLGMTPASRMALKVGAGAEGDTYVLGDATFDNRRLEVSDELAGKIAAARDGDGHSPRDR